MASPSDSFPARKAHTGSFRHGRPRSAEVYGDATAWRVRYLAGSGPEDAVLSLHEIDHTGAHRVLADPRALIGGNEELPAAERARRERLREGGAGITGFSSDTAGRRAVFPLSGELWLCDADGARQLPAVGAVVDPRLSPDGRWVAYHAGGGLHLLDPDSGEARPLCTPDRDEQTWGLAEFIAAEEMGRYRGFWWSPDSDALLVCEVDEEPVQRWWISNPADPSQAARPIPYPAAGTANAVVRLWLVGLDATRVEVAWDRDALPYLAAVRWDAAGALISAQSRDQRLVQHMRVDADGTTSLLAEQQHRPWVDIVPGSPRLAADGDIVLVDVDPDNDAARVRKGRAWLTPPEVYVSALLRCDEQGIWCSATRDPREHHLFLLADGGARQLTPDGGWHAALAAGPVPVVALSAADAWQPRFVVGDPLHPAAELPNLAESPAGAPRVRFLDPVSQVRVAVVLPHGEGPAPVIVSSYGGPHAQRVVRAPLAFAVEQWFADQGFAVVTIDGRGSPGVAPSCEAAIAGDLAGPPLQDQIAGLRAAAAAFPDRLDTARVGIRGWSFGGYLSALAVLRAPEVFHAAFAGAPVTEWRLYDTHYTERYLGLPDREPDAYDRSSLLPLAPDLRRPLCLVHGMADDNVVAAHTLQLSAALTAAGRPHEVLPLPGVSHMTPQVSITRSLLELELAFFDQHLAEAPQPLRAPPGLPSN